MGRRKSSLWPTVVLVLCVGTAPAWGGFRPLSVRTKGAVAGTVQVKRWGKANPFAFSEVAGRTEEKKERKARMPWEGWRVAGVVKGWDGRGSALLVSPGGQTVLVSTKRQYDGWSLVAIKDGKVFLGRGSELYGIPYRDGLRLRMVREEMGWDPPSLGGAVGKNPRKRR